ncbi:BZ3500_MvSof-1268-A1-R1_Chr1-1g01158 [Microbotryum saponariae]|uniref:BZ3500_MvSof-1268-A1-R1_Chr1-1g01158 protein n=1 Tax=Microbotryum saponariae TaxID=289078 RepID=A0A2X0MMG4_9BASI|nr:BZ3500_MvSof-1268-A1-R1_Chr1-1g01158 [Microbotryum saponariae]SCZ93534.1 BZ3501_MvSof-1269-A2-R1_Chr1-1g00755 [Microbotryum saponariae]
MPRLKILLAGALLAGFAAARCSGGHRRHHVKIQTMFKPPILGSPSNHSVPFKTDGPYLSLAKVQGSSSPSMSGASAPTFDPNVNTNKSTQNQPPDVVGWALDGVSKYGIALGFIPDDGSGGGTRQTIAEISSMIGQRVSAQGYYAQVIAGHPFDGWQLLSKMDQIAKDGGVFQASIMPINGWAGLTWEDDRQAVAICTVLKNFTHLPKVEVWFRFAHEVNWYLNDGTYKGTVDDFQQGWSVVAAACKKIAPRVRMWFTPNVANLEEYDRYYPTNHSTVDLIGIDYYPKVLSTADFVKVMKPFHDKYCTSSGPYFAIGETAVGSEVSMTDRINWLKHILSPETKMQLPFLIAVTWVSTKAPDYRRTEPITYLNIFQFNFDKMGIDYRIADTPGPTSLAIKLFLDAGDD